jgi:hypothetical protein
MKGTKTKCGPNNPYTMKATKTVAGAQAYRAIRNRAPPRMLFAPPATFHYPQRRRRSRTGSACKASARAFKEYKLRTAGRDPSSA